MMRWYGEDLSAGVGSLLRVPGTSARMIIVTIVVDAMKEKIDAEIIKIA